MRRFVKKTASACLAAMLAMTLLAGCGGSSAGTEAPAESAPAAEEEAAAVEETAEAEAEAPAAEGGAFYIGGIGPTTGGAAAYGLGVKNGAQIAVDEINAAGGINGAKIEYKFEDDELNAEKSVNAYNTLKDWGMQILMGSVTSGCSVAVSEKTLEDNMFQLTPSGSAQDCTKYDNVFRVCFSDPQQGNKSADYIVDNGLATKVGVIYDSSDIYSSGIYQTFAAQAEVRGLEIVSAEAFNSDNKTDFSVQVQKAKDAGADLVFLPIYYTEASLILQQADKIGYKPAFFGCDGLDGLTGVENFDLSLAEGVMLLTPFAADSDDENVQSFVKAYQDQFGEIPNQFAADAYDAIYAIKAAIEASGATPDMEVSDLCEALKSSFVSMSVKGLTGAGGEITWDASGDPNKDPAGVVIENGAYKAMN